MNGTWGASFGERFKAYDDAIATILTRDNREFYCKPDELEVLDNFPAAWLLTSPGLERLIPESEIVRVEVTYAEGE